MARAFDGSSYLRYASGAPVTAAPLTIAAWCLCDNGDSGSVVALTDGTLNNEFYVDVFGGDLYVAAKQAGLKNEAAGPSSFSALAWRHFAGVFASTSSVYAFINGVKGTQATTARTPASLSEVTVGTAAAGGNNLSSGTAAAEVGIWNVALSDAEIMALAKGARPSTIRPESLVFYAPIMGDSPEPDLTIGGRDLTVTGTTVVAHPPVSPYLLGPPMFGHTLQARQTVSVAQAAETDTAQPVGRVKQRAVAQASETDTAQPLTRVKRKAVAQAAETDTAQTIARLKQRGLGQVTETDAAQAVLRVKQRGVGQVAETDTAQAMVRRKQRLLGIAAETDTALTVARVKMRPLGQAAETDTALTIVRFAPAGAGGGRGAGGSFGAGGGRGAGGSAGSGGGRGAGGSFGSGSDRGPGGPFT